ncbi:ABC transporter ATP-binding protein [Caldilinea sp.]|uniref:ABC transporter ATP-binding protein n=1 Tax=Caldilinea sp. TaxID=2293560 RepID=UPI002C58FCF8|nr:ABC transporter ATP-binding protein [Caldilinea sp.]
MGFLMDGIDAEGYDRTYTDRQLLSRIFDYFRPHLGVMAFVATMIVLDSLMSAVLPILIARGLDTIAIDGSWQRAGVLIGAILVSGALAWTFNFFRQWNTARAVGNVVLELRQDAFDAVMERDMSFYDEYATGKIVSRVTSDTQDFANVVTLTLNLISQVLLVAIIFGVLFFINTRLAFIAAAIAPVIVLIALGFRRLARRTTQQARRVLAEVNAKVQETVSGIGVAKAFRQEETIYHEFDAVNQQSYRINLRQGFVFSGIFPVLNAVAGIGTALVVYFGGMSVLDGQVTPGDWFLFVESISLFWLPLTGIASFWSQFQLGMSASERVFALIDAEPRVVQIDSRPAKKLRGRIEFRNLSFRYTEQERVLHNFDLIIPAGQTVALVGHTGAGKSSLGKLVARFYEFQEGQILIDDQDIRTFDLTSYRQRLGIVPQTPFLFTGTVAENIRYARQDADDETVRTVAEQIGGGDWLHVLENGIETDVGEEGRGISMGQRQLVALARVLIQDPAIVVLDEATASVDPLTEAQIQEGLDVVLRDRTAIVIAHRLSTIKAADRIIVLRKGEIIEEGDHDALMAQGGHYAELYNTYFRHQSPDYDPVAVEVNEPVAAAT